MDAWRAMRLSAAFILIGVLGAMIKYWQWWPSGTGAYFYVSGFACPFCPSVDGIGSNLDKFVGRTFMGGVLNLIPALLVGWTVIGVKALRHLKRRY